MVDIGEVLPAFQVQSKTQTQRFKDQTFEQLEKLVQIKVLEDFLDAAIKGKKGKLPYNSLPDTASVLEVAPCFPADVVYKRPREMEPADSAEAILAAMRRFTGAVGSDEVQQDAAGDAVPTGVVNVDGKWLLDGGVTTSEGVKMSVVHLGVPREAGPALVGTSTQRRAQWMSAIPSGSSDGGLLDLRALPMIALHWEACLSPPAQLLMAAPLGKEHGRQRSGAHQAAPARGPAGTATLPVKRVHWAAEAHDNATGDAPRLGNVSGRGLPLKPPRIQ
ncbi:hypothetical protein WJX75_009181 [Coccomyxa subellipsoidea]|uniref:PNPLA domain-containing protein n=1 Tax=Coccomyxa subellipsoidea TaxID=248742 RepID=A0ABR2YB23_9CHLO